MKEVCNQLVEQTPFLITENGQASPHISPFLSVETLHQSKVL